MDNKKWTPSQDENLGVITSVYEFIKEEPVSYTHLTLPTNDQV